MLFRFFASAVAAMLLFEAPATAVGPTRIHDGPQPDRPRTVPAGRPVGRVKQCLRAAELAYRAVRTSSDLLGRKVPGGSAEA